MIPNETPQRLDTIGTVKEVGSFKITDATQARILVSLSDKMYTRKELAVIREYSNNANDAHIVVGKPTSEVIVTLPTQEDLVFKVRDFGQGLTVDQIRDVYCVLGESTKRNSAQQNGVLGYGCKAGFAHADSFTVTAWVNGEKAIYNCVKGDSTHLHSVIELSRTPSDEPSGIEVAVPVKQSSLWTFHQEAADFFKFWEVLPTFVNLHPDYQVVLDNYRKIAATLVGEGWSIRPRSDSSAVGVAFMGGVPYRIDWNVLNNRMALEPQTRVLFDLLQSNDVTLFFKMGEVQFVDSRESLEYTDMTLDALIARIRNIFDKIKDSIQEKFTPATNIWEAKMIYNAIFGTGLLEVEDTDSDDEDAVTKIKILEGNLSKLEDTFKDAFQWNGIPLRSSGFNALNRFDNSDTTEIKGFSHSPSEPVMTTYRKKKKRVKTVRCTLEGGDSITASHRVAVVINDTNAKTGQSMVSRYLIFKDNSNTLTVHVLRFANDDIKNLFFNELNFDTVPVIKMSDIIADAKAWNKANKTSRSYGNGGGGTRPMEYIDIEAGTIEESEVPVREIEEGAFFVHAGPVEFYGGWRRKRRVKTISSFNRYSYVRLDNDSVAHIKNMIEEMDLDISRVYIINKVSAQTKWFEAAVKSGDWINFWDYVKENIDQVPNRDQVMDAENFSEVVKPHDEIVEKIVPKLMDSNSPLIKYINLIKSQDFSGLTKIVRSFKEFAGWDMLSNGVALKTDFNKIEDSVRDVYPFMSLNDLGSTYGMNDTKIEQIVKYVNAIDLFNDLTSMPETEKQEETATEEVAETESELVAA